MPGFSHALFGRSIQPYAEILAEHPFALRRHRDGARTLDAANPVPAERVRAERGADRAREVRPPFAPVEAWPAQHALRALACRADLDPEPPQEPHALAGDDAGVLRKLRMSARDQRIRDRN